MEKASATRGPVVRVHSLVLVPVPLTFQGATPEDLALVPVPLTSPEALPEEYEGTLVLLVDGIAQLCSSKTAFEGLPKV